MSEKSIFKNTLVSKDLPNPKKRNIIPPDMDYVYFEGADDYPMEPENEDYSPVNAWWFAECSLLAYCHPGFARMAYELAGFDGFHFLGATGTECMASWNDQVAVVSFRGTELRSLSVLQERRTDLNATPIPFELGGNVHRGFLDGLGEIWDGPEGLESLLARLIDEKPDRPLWITGHSLGGAMAALCFARTPRAKGLYIYGSPRVGDSEFLTLLEGRSAWRIENSQDPIPLVPIGIPLLGFNFADLGRLKFLSSDGSVVDKRPVFVLEDHKAKYREAIATLDTRIKGIGKTGLSKDKGAKDVFGEIDQQIKVTKKEWRAYMDGLFTEIGLNVDHHQPIFYAVKIWNDLVSQVVIKDGEE